MHIRFFLFIVSILISSKSYARFEHEDAGLIDREELHGSEAFIDMLSYRPTIYSLELWDQSKNGFRINIGSLNVTRFLHDERIKLSSETEAAYLSYTRKKYQDMTENSDLSLVQVSWLDLIPGVGIGFLGEGDSFKEYADLGFAIHNSNIHDLFFWQISYLLVDTTYNNKKSYPEDQMVREPKTIELLLRYRIHRYLTRLKIEVDTPIEWHKNSSDYHFFGERNFAQLDLQFPLGDYLTFINQIQIENKKERKKTFYLEQKELMKDISEPTRQINTVPSLTDKSFDRKIQTFESKVQYREEGDVYELGIWATVRNSKYTFLGYEAISSERYQDAGRSASSTRKEVSLFAVREPAFTGEGNWRYHQSIYLNSMIRTEQQDRYDNEGKLNTAFTWLATESAHINFNITWDLDEIHRNFITLSGPLSPWGGGNVHFQWTF